METKTHLVSALSISSTASHAIRASGEVAPNFLLASRASWMALLASGRAVERRKVGARDVVVIAGAKAEAAGRTKKKSGVENFMVDFVFSGGAGIMEESRDSAITTIIKRTSHHPKAFRSRIAQKVQKDRRHSSFFSEQPPDASAWC